MKRICILVVLSALAIGCTPPPGPMQSLGSPSNTNNTTTTTTTTSNTTTAAVDISPTRVAM